MRYLLIPAAGESARFAKEGYVGPKCLLNIEFQGKTAPMLQHTLDNCISQLEMADVTIILGCLVEHKPLFERFFEELEEQRKRDLNYVIVGFTEKTQGQSDTLYKMLEHFSLKIDDSAVVLNSDVWFSQIAIRRIFNAMSDSCVYVGEETDEDAKQPPKYSYIYRLGSRYLFLEKKRDPTWSGGEFQIGAWVFRSIFALRATLRAQLELEFKQRGEYYLSGALCLYPRQLDLAVLDRIDWKDFGTPESLEKNGARILR